MQLTEISKTKTPEKFFTRFDTENQTWLENEVIPSPDGIRLRRKAKDGWQDMWISTADWSSHLFHVRLDEDQVEQQEEVAVGQIFMEYLDWETSAWTINPFDSMYTELVDGKILVSLADSLTGATMTIEQEWKLDSEKQTYKGKYLGQKIRVLCIVKLINPNKAIIDYSDYLSFDMETEQNTGLGLVSDEVRNIAGTDFRYLIFARDGLDDEIEIDPYISLEENATSIRISCDGYGLEIFTDIDTSSTSGLLYQIYDPTFTTIWHAIKNRPMTNGTQCSLRNGARTTTYQNCGTHIVIKSVGNLGYQTTQSISTTDYADGTWVIYPDRFFVTFTMHVAPSKTWSFGSGTALMFVVGNGTACDIAVGWGDTDNGNEYVPSSDIHRLLTSSYLMRVPTVCNLTMNITHMDMGGHDQIWEYLTPVYDGIGYGPYRESDGVTPISLPEGTVGTVTACFIIDSASREHGSKFYDKPTRLEQGEQYKTTDLTPTTGAAVTTVAGLTAIGTDGFQSDGAQHISVDGTTKEIAYTADVIRHKKVDVIHDFPIQSGDAASPTDHLLFWDKMDNITNPHDAEFATGSASVSMGDVPASVVDGGTYFGPTDAIDGLVIAGSGNCIRNSGTISLEYTPDNTTETTQRRLFAGDSAGFYSLYIPAAVEAFYFSWNDVDSGDVPYPITPGVKLSIQAAYEVIDNGDATWTTKMWLIIAGKVIWTRFTTNAENNTSPTTLYVGQRDASDNESARGVIKHFKIYDAPVLPFGSYFIGNGGLNTDLIHSKIMYYNSDGRTLDFGGGNTYLKTAGNINAAQGSMSFWFVDVNKDSSSDLLVAGSGSDFKVEWGGNTPNMNFCYAGNELISAETTAKGMNHLKISWKENDFISTEMNGIVTVMDISSSAPTLVAEFVFYGRVYNMDFSKIFITSDPNTTQIPTVDREPIHIPISEKS